MAILGRIVAWLVLVAGFAAHACTAFALGSMSADQPENVPLGYSLFYLAPIFCMFGAFLVFESWASVRSGVPNPWPTVVLIYVCIVSSQAMLLCMSTPICAPRDLLTLRQHLADPRSVFGALALLIVFGFYAATIIRHARQVPFTALFGRCALWLWLLHFTCTRLWQPMAAIDKVLETLR